MFFSSHNDMHESRYRRGGRAVPKDDIIKRLWRYRWSTPRRSKILIDRLLISLTPLRLLSVAQFRYLFISSICLQWAIIAEIVEKSVVYDNNNNDTIRGILLNAAEFYYISIISYIFRCVGRHSCGVFEGGTLCK